MKDIEYDETRALNAVDDIRKATGRSFSIDYNRGRHHWDAGVNDEAHAPLIAFDSVDEAITWAYWMAGAR